MVNACKCPNVVGCAFTEFIRICGQICEDLKALKIHFSPPPTISHYVLKLKVSDKLHKTIHYFP
jgi:hypothetical protein